MHERVFAGLGVSLLLAGGIWAAAAQDLDAGKSPQQLFSANCAACHRSPHGLLKSGSAAGAAGFLRQHYTSGPASATALAGYLASVGPDPRAARQRGEPNRAGARPDGPPRRAEEAAAGPDPRSERQRRADRNAQRLERAARAEAEQRRAAEPRGLSPSRLTVRRPPGEPATVSADPPSILIATDPKPVAPRLAARGQIVPAAAETSGGATAPSQRTEPATAALPAPSAPGSDAAAPPAVSESSAGAASAPSAVAAAPEPSAAPDDLPAYPPRLNLDVWGVTDGPAERSSAADTASRPNGAQAGFSAPLP